MPNAAQKRRMKLKQQQQQLEEQQQQEEQEQPLVESITQEQALAMEEEEKTKRSRSCSYHDDDDDDDSFDEGAASSSSGDIAASDDADRDGDESEDNEEEEEADGDGDEGMPDAASPPQPSAPAVAKANAKAKATAKGKAKAKAGPQHSNKGNNNGSNNNNNNKQAATKDSNDLVDQNEGQGSVEEALKGWPRPKENPPGWPPVGAELLACHSQVELSTALVDSSKNDAAEAGETGTPDLRRRLLLAGLTCPQPNDALQWRIFPLVRQALALETSQDAAALAKHVEGGLPKVCLAHTSKSHLRGLVNLVLSRSLRCGRLKEKNKRYSLPPSENPSVPIPEGILGLVLKELWTAWCIETKKPREVGMLFSSSSSSSSGAAISSSTPSSAAASASAASVSSAAGAAAIAAPGSAAAMPIPPTPSLPSSSLWLFARPLAKNEDQAARSADFADPLAIAGLLRDRITVNGLEVTALASPASAGPGVLRADWYEPKAKVAWALLPAQGSSLPADLIPEVVMACSNST